MNVRTAVPLHGPAALCETSEMGRGGGDVTLVAPPASSLAIALGAALGAHGWQVREVDGLRPVTAARGRTVLVIEDDTGRAVVRPTPGLALHTCVGIGSARSAGRLRDLHRRGAVVLDQQAPLLVLLLTLEHHLSAPPHHAPPDPAVDGELRRRHAEGLALARLTGTERAVLALLSTGVGAAQIGARRHLSMNTVRTHIRSILTKLGVRSQLEAVAVARRSAPGLAGTTATFTNSGEDPVPARGGP